MVVDILPNFEDCNCYAVRAAARHVMQHYDQFLSPTRLRTTQFSILAKLRRRGPLTITELANEMTMDRTTLGRNILPLQRDRLTEPSASDRRMKVLRLTKGGEKRLEVARREWSAAQASFERVFGAARATELRALLRAVMASELGPQTHRGAQILAKSRQVQEPCEVKTRYKSRPSVRPNEEYSRWARAIARKMPRAGKVGEK